MKEKLKFTLEVEVEIDGTRPSDDVLYECAINAMGEAFPSLLLDDAELDCTVLANSWCYEKA